LVLSRSRIDGEERKRSVSHVPPIRIRVANEKPVRSDGRFVLYWMIASRRLTWNFALQRAVEWARDVKRPLVVLEALNADYPWASDRLHAFVLQGMADNLRLAEDAGVAYYPYVEPEAETGRGLLKALAADACVVVTDDFPAFFLPGLVRAAAGRVPVRLEAVDANGIVPLRATDRAYPTAYAFRGYLHKELPTHLETWPLENPLKGLDLPSRRRPPAAVTRRWALAAPELLAAEPDALAALPIDHEVEPVALPGGPLAGGAYLDRFLKERLPDYGEHRNTPDRSVTSELSPYLHFGHISPHEVLSRLAELEGWTPADLEPGARGGRGGWGMRASATEFADQFITWRELGLNMCAHRADYDEYDSLPDWALKTLREHARDPREHLYSLEQFESAATHDTLWNAVQTQLLRDGAIHNYLRMLWGKKILEWSRSPKAALDVMIELNNKYALDGRDPNSYSGIFWVLGRYDRPWGPERPVFGKVRYMSSANTARKHRITGYLSRYGDQAELAVS
jgi:deoxyribodipyrimidine photo-lyase